MALSYTVAIISGCTAVAVGGAATGGYYAAKDKRTLATITSDAALSTKIKTKLIADEYVKAGNINVDTYDSVVTLHGNVPSEAIKERTIQLTRSIKGVKKVITKLLIIPPPDN